MHLQREGMNLGVTVGKNSLNEGERVPGSPGWSLGQLPINECNSASGPLSDGVNKGAFENSEADSVGPGLALEKIEMEKELKKDT